jgi:hypothetical protein
MTMSVASEVAASWNLSPLAKYQLEECGLAFSEVYRVLRQPEAIFPGINGGKRFQGYGLVVTVDTDETIETILIDGATAENWSDWAAERAYFADGDVAGADALLRRDLAPRVPGTAQDAPRRRRRRQVEPATPTTKSHILDAVHPALREEITRQVAGDFSRLVVHSPLKVSVLPPRE